MNLPTGKQQDSHDICGTDCGLKSAIVSQHVSSVRKLCQDIVSDAAKPVARSMPGRNQ